MSTTAGEREERKRRVDAEKARIWTNCIRAGLEAKAEWLEARRDVLSYFNVTHDKFFDESLSQGSTFLNLDRGIQVSVNRAALIRAVIAPHLYQKAPTREVNTTRSDAVSVALSRVLELLLNYSVRESNFTKAVYRLIDDAELAGLGALRTVWDDVYKIVTSVWVPSDRIVVDPAAVTLDDARWIAISTRMPLDEVEETYGGKGNEWRVEELKAAAGKEELGGGSPGALSSYLRDQISVWDVYSKRGTGLKRGPEALDETHEFRNDNDDKKYVKFTIVLDHKQTLEEGPWEWPLYLDKRWPITTCQFVESLDRFWAPSPMQQAMPHQKNADLFASLLTAQARIDSRDVLFYRAGMLDADAVEQVLHGGPHEAVALGDLPVGMKAQDVIYQLPLGKSSEGIMRGLDWHLGQFDLISGATPVLQGGVDPGPQDRSATASQQKSAAANVRLMDQLSRVEDALAQAGRNEAIAWRLGGLAKIEDVQRIVGDLDLGWRLDATVPVKLRGAGVSLETLHSLCATYYPSAMGVDEEGNAERHPRYGPDPLLLEQIPQLEMALQQAAMLPGATEAQEIVMGMVMSKQGFRPRRVTAKDVFEDTAGMGPEEIVREFTFSVAAGSTQKQDTAAKRERAVSLEQNALPAALKSGDYNMVNAILARADDAFGVPPDERLPPMKPPMPPPMPGEPPGGPSPEEVPA